MTVRFQADADFNQTVVAALKRREPAVDFQTAHAAGLAGLDDPVVLTLAAQEGRILVSHDNKTMPTHFARFVAATTCPGLLIVPKRLSPSLMVDQLLLIWTTTEAEEWVNRICYLPF